MIASPKGTFDDFLYALRSFESGVDYERYQAGVITEWQIRDWVGEENWAAYQAGELTWTELQYRSENSLGFVGYQFGEALLIDLGYYEDDVYYGNGASSNTWDGTFTGKNGINSLDDLKTELQEKVILDAFGYNLNVIKNGLQNSGQSLDDFIGQTFTYTDVDGSTVSVELTLTGILAAAHLRGAWGTLNLLQGGNASTDEYGTSILKYAQQFGGYDAPKVETLIDDYLAGVSMAPTGGDDSGSLTLAWAWGSHEVIDGFDPAQDRINFVNQFGANDIRITENGGDVVIEVLFSGSAQQSYTLKNVSLSDLSPSNFVNVSGTRDFIEEAFTTSSDTDTSVPDTAEDTDSIVPVSDPEVAEPEAAEPEQTEPELAVSVETPTDVTEEAPVAGSGQTVTITWNWGANAVIQAFNPATDVLNFGWMQPGNLNVTENANGDLVIEIPSNNQSYVFEGISLSDLSMDNIEALDASMTAFFAERVGSGASTETGETVSETPEADDETGSGNMSEDMDISDGGSDADGDTTTDVPAADPVEDTHDHGDDMGDEDTSGDTGSEVVEGGTSVGNQDSSGSGEDTPFVGGGTVHAVNSSGADIEGFDPATDQLDFGSISVHGLILTETADGEAALRNVWGSDAQVLKGVSVADLTQESLGVVGNEHLREDLGGILSWEKGIGPRDADTVYILSHQVGKVTTITDFDAATDKISFLYYGTREQLTVEQDGADLVISTGTTGQTFIFKDLSLRDLTPGQLEFHFDQVMEDNLEVPFGVSQEDVSLVSRTSLLTPDAPAGATTDGHQVREGSTVPIGHDPSGEQSTHGDHNHDDMDMSGDMDMSDSGSDAGGDTMTDVPATDPVEDTSDDVDYVGGGDTITITWNWGQHDEFDFNPAEDMLDFGWLTSDNFDVQQTAEGILIEVVGNDHSYLLSGLTADDLSAENYSALNTSAQAELDAFFL
jgi:hypothetical protein